MISEPFHDEERLCAATTAEPSPTCSPKYIGLLRVTYMYRSDAVDGVKFWTKLWAYCCTELAEVSPFADPDLTKTGPGQITLDYFFRT